MLLRSLFVCPCWRCREARYEDALLRSEATVAERLAAGVEAGRLGRGTARSGAQKWLAAIEALGKKSDDARA